jgi:hypothetical protein
MQWKEDRIKADRQTLAELRRQLKAVDDVIRSHEVTVEPEGIKGRKTYRERIAPHGEMSRFLIAQFRLAGDTPVCTTDLAIRFLRHLKKDVTMLTLKDARTRVGMSLRDIAKNGIIVARHLYADNGAIIEGYWVLADQAG